MKTKIKALLKRLYKELQEAGKAAVYAMRHQRYKYLQTKHDT